MRVGVFFSWKDNCAKPLWILQVLRDLHHLRDTGQWHQTQTRAEFWKKCNDTFTKHSICSRAAAGFFLQQANDVWGSSGQEKATSIMERQLLLTLAGHWLAKEPEVALQELEEVEKQIWLCRVSQRALEAGDSGQCPSPSPAGLPSALSFGSLAQEFSFSRLPALNTARHGRLEALAAGEPQLGPAERAALAALVGALLDEGSVLEATRVCHYFQLWHRDVSLVLHCRALASGEAGLEQLQPEVRALLAARAGTGEGGAASGAPSSE